MASARLENGADMSDRERPRRTRTSRRSETFDFRFHPAFRLAALPLGVRESTAAVTVGGGDLDARFGPWHVTTPLSNIEAAHVTGPYAWPKVIGPAHLSFADRGLTFATNADRGVCVQFRDPVRGIDPWGRLLHPSLTLTVADPDALAELLDPTGSAR